MNKQLARLIVLATAGAAGAAFAQGYVGLAAGQARVNIDCSGTLTCDKSDTAAKVFGGFMFTPNWGVEAAYYDQGKLHQTASDEALGAISADWRGNGYGAFGVAALPLDAWALFAKLGVVQTKVKFDATSSTAGRASASERHADFAWGGGGEFRFADHWAARVEFEQVRLKFQDEKRHANLLTAGMLYRF